MSVLIDRKELQGEQMIKPNIFRIVILVIACSICLFVGYTAGIARSKERQKGTFIMTFAGVDEIRAGLVSEGVRQIEKVCFANADRIYSDPAYSDSGLLRLFVPDLIKYRSQYCTNQSDWTPEEERLEKRLREITMTPKK